MIVVIFRICVVCNVVEVECLIFVDRVFTSDGDFVGVLYEERFRVWGIEVDMNR